MKNWLIMIISMTLFSTFAIAGGYKQHGTNASMGDRMASQESDHRFMKLDADRNGHISFPEAQGRHRIIYYYDVADTNDDGHIDKAEFSAFEVQDAVQ